MISNSRIFSFFPKCVRKITSSSCSSVHTCSHDALSELVLLEYEIKMFHQNKNEISLEIAVEVVVGAIYILYE